MITHQQFSENWPQLASYFLKNSLTDVRVFDSLEENDHTLCILVNDEELNEKNILSSRNKLIFLRDEIASFFKTPSSSIQISTPDQIDPVFLDIIEQNCKHFKPLRSDLNNPNPCPPFQAKSMSKLIISN